MNDRERKGGEMILEQYNVAHANRRPVVIDSARWTAMYFPHSITSPSMEDELLKELNRAAMAFNEQYNKNTLDDFEGLSPFQMMAVLHKPFSPEFIFEMNEDLEDDILLSSYYFRDMVTFLKTIMEEQPVQLTAKGNLPRKLVQELVRILGMEEDSEYIGSHPIMKETDSFTIHGLNLLARHTGLTRKTKNRLHLTKRTEKLLQKDLGALYRDIFIYYCTRYNWGYTDRYPESWIVQASFGFSLYLVHLHGDRELIDDFYYRKFIQAFPDAVDDFRDHLIFPDIAHRCYRTRVLKQFMHRFGLIEISCEQVDLTDEICTLKRTELFDRLFLWRV